MTLIKQEKPTRHGGSTAARIRTLRLSQGMRQADLARQVEISTSYMNLIEHGRRAVGGALLSRLAEALGTDVSRLRDGAEAPLLEACEAAGSAHPETGAELEKLHDMAERYPGWARLIAVQHAEAQRATQTLRLLNDRLAHDTGLSASIHDALSSVTSIRSASAILAREDDVEPAWQRRFSRNIFEDSQRLAETMTQLVTHLDDDSDAPDGPVLPQEELEKWLADRDWTIVELEQDPAAEVAHTWTSGAAGRLASTYFAIYADAVATLPRERLLEAVQDVGSDAFAIATRTGVDVPVVMRRLATLSAEDHPDGQPCGVVACDASGTLTFRKPVAGFDMPQFGAACPLWPIFQALQRPQAPLRQTVRLPGVGSVTTQFDVQAFATTRYPAGFDSAGVTEAWMLVTPRLDPDKHAAPVGLSCRTCAHEGCAARREPAFFEAF